MMYKSRLYIEIRFQSGFPAQVFRFRADIGRIYETCAWNCRSDAVLLFKLDLYTAAVYRRNASFAWI